MNHQSIRQFLYSRTARLAASYLAIIMILCVGFSFVLYKTSAHELGRQIPPPSVFRLNSPDFGRHDPYHSFFVQRIEEARSHLLGKLIILNLLVLAGGAAVSYYLARRTLEPIENAMEAQSRFVTDASHELRTPLTAMLAGNEVALRKSHLTLNQAKAVIASNTEEIILLKGLTDGLLSLASQEETATAVKPISLQDVAAEAMNRILPMAQARQITVDDKVPNLVVEGNSQAAVQVLTVLLDNAIKYSPAKSIIYLEGSTADGYGYLNVRDEGVGINADDIPHIFDRFYRADQARGKSDTPGYGIGLAVAQKLMELQSGKIGVRSIPGAGSTFSIYFKLSQAL